MAKTLKLEPCDYCDRSHFGGEHRVYRTSANWYQRYGRCKVCHKYVGNMLYDEPDDPALKLGYHTLCFKKLTEEARRAIIDKA